MPKPQSTTRKAPVTYPLRLTTALDDKVTAAAAETTLSKQDVMRLSIERGLEILLNQLRKA
jgi:hypothetical protein